MLPKWLSLRGRKFVKIISSSIKIPHAQQQYVHSSIPAKFKRHSLKTVRGIDIYPRVQKIAKTPKFLRP